MVRANLGELSARVSLDTVDFSRNLASLKREMRTAKTDMDLAAKGVHGFGDGLSSTEAQMKLVERQVGLNQQAMQRYSREYDEAAKAARNGDGEISKAMQNSQRKHQEARLEVERLTEQYRELYKVNARESSTFYQVADTMETVGGKMQTVGKNVESFGHSWTRTGAVVGLAAGGVIKTAMDFEKSMANVEKTTGASTEEMESLGREIRDLSHSIPVTAAELGNMAALGGQLGILPEHLGEFTEVVAALEVATNITGEEAGKMMAQFANITNMPHDQFDNLASSIVKIGNNTATTEKDVAEMAMHLAGAGEAAGLTEAEIIGLAGGLSSLGIAAERGGSSFSRIMIDMATSSATGVEAARELEQATGLTMREIELMSSNAGGDFKELADSLGMTRQEIMKVVNSANDLEGFAKIAGMSAEEFARAFQEDAVGAIGHFIDGLAQGEAAGESAIHILDELGISEIRLRDTLLRAGNARGVFNETVQMSNEAFAENTELLREAEIYYGTTDSQLKIFRNRLQDVAIEAGTALLPALIGLTESADPLIERISSLSDWFVALDDNTKEFIVQLGALLVFGGPVVTMLGKFIGGFGTLTSALGKGGKALFDWSLEGQVAGKSMETMAGMASKAAGAKGIGALTASLSGFSAIALPIVGAGGVLALGYGAWKLWGEEAYESAQRTKQWGTDVGEEADKALNKFQEMSEGASQATREMSQNVEEGATKAIESYSAMATEIATSAQETIAEQEAELATLPDRVREIMQGLSQERIAEQEAIIRETETINNEINTIYERALENNRELTNSELEMIEDHHRRLNELRSETLDLSVEDQRQVQSVLLDDLKTFSREELLARREHLNQQTKELGEMYDEQLEIIREAVIKGEITQEQANTKEAALLEERERTNMEFAKEYVKVWNELGAPIEQQNEILAEYGLTHADVMQAIAMDSAEAREQFGLLAETTGELSEEAREANIAWNNLILDDETGEVHTNLKEFIQETSEADDGWEQLEFILKHAELSTNAQDTIREALEENGKWNELDWYHHEANLFTNAQQIAMEYLKANGDWDDLEFAQKTAFLDTNTPEQLQQILQDYGLWERLDPSVKEMIVTSNAPQKSREGHAAIDDWNSLRPLPTHLNATTNVPAVVRNAQRAIDSLRGKTVRVETVHSTVGVPSGPYATRNAAGLNFHPGGHAILGDGGQHEPYLTPDGTFGISPKQDTLYDMPRGTKVWRSIDNLLKEIPQYARGTLNQPIKVGDQVFNQISDALRPFHAPVSLASGSQTVQNNNTYNIHLNIQGELPQPTIRKMAEQIEREIKNANDRRKASRGERVSFG